MRKGEGGQDVGEGEKKNTCEERRCRACWVQEQNWVRHRCCFEASPGSLDYANDASLAAQRLLGIIT